MNVPGIPEVSAAVAELLRQEEIGALATIDEDGCPSASSMHGAADGSTVYMHTFTYNRNYYSSFISL